MFSNAYQEYSITNDVGFNDVNVGTDLLDLLHTMHIPNLGHMGSLLHSGVRPCGGQPWANCFPSATDAFLKHCNSGLHWASGWDLLSDFCPITTPCWGCQDNQA